MSHFLATMFEKCSHTLHDFWYLISFLLLKHIRNTPSNLHWLLLILPQSNFANSGWVLNIYKKVLCISIVERLELCWHNSVCVCCIGQPSISFNQAYDDDYALFRHTLSRKYCISYLVYRMITQNNHTMLTIIKKSGESCR